MKNNNLFISEGCLKSDDPKKDCCQIPSGGKYIYFCWHDDKVEISLDEGESWSLVGDLNESIN